MSANVNILIEKMNQETLKQKKLGVPTNAGGTTAPSKSSRGSTRIKAAEQEIVNNESIKSFAEKSIVKMLNFRPGKLMTHLEEQDIKSLFITKKYYNIFFLHLHINES